MTELVLTLQIERMAYGADAIAHTPEGKTIFVSGAVPGDTAEVEVIQDGSNFSKGRVTHIVESSKKRVAPPCPYATICGGCPWGVLSKEAQLEAKRSSVVDALVRIGHFETAKAESLVADCERPSADWGYRNKVELAISWQKGRLVVGMHAIDGSVIKVDSCPLLQDKHAKLVKAVSGALGYLGGTSELDLERVGIRVALHTKDIEIALWGKPGAFPRAQAAKVLGDATHANSMVRILTKGLKKTRRITGVEVLSGKGYWTERIAGQRMALSAPSFFQVNTLGAERLIELVLAGLDPQPDEEAMDLYCGAGTFTLPLAKRCEFVSAVEASGPAVRDLRRNLDNAQLQNVDVIGGDAGREFPDSDANLIVVDPPRAGLAENVVTQLSEQRVRRIAYVSCDPATLARDLARFCAIGNYRPLRITPVDLFPQTYHVECVVLMSRGDVK